MANNETITLPNGKLFLTKVVYTSGESHGISVLIVVSTFSLIAVLALLTSIAVSAWNTRRSINPHLFVRTHASAYLVSLLLCDLLQSIGSIMNAPWQVHRAVTFGQVCVAQGVIKHMADVGTATWSLLIALHTFWILFLNFDTPKLMLISVLVGGWSIIFSLVIAGPATMNTAKNGSFFGISGYWCWISNQYPGARIGFDYLWLFLSAISSFVLYSLVFLKLRDPMYRGREVVDPQIIAIARQMLLYPVAYAIIILPISIVRFTEWSGHRVPFAGIIFADSIFLLSGVVNVLLFTLTRRVLPRHSVITTHLTWIPGNNDDDPENPPVDETASRADSDETAVDSDNPTEQKDPKATKEEEEEPEEIIKYLPTLDKVDDDYDDIYDYYRRDRASNLFLTVQSPDDEAFGRRPDLMIQVTTPISRSPRHPPVIPHIPRTPSISLPDHDPDSGRLEPVSLASARIPPSPLQGVVFSSSRRTASPRAQPGSLSSTRPPPSPLAQAVALQSTRPPPSPLAHALSLSGSRLPPRSPSLPYSESSSESEYDYSERESPLSESPKDMEPKSPASAPGPRGGLTFPKEIPRFATPQVATFPRDIFSRRT